MKTIMLPLATLAFAVPAAAQTRDVPVRHADLDLGTREGITSLDRRIGVAVEAACPPDDDRTLAHRAMVRHCQAVMLKSARAARDRAIAHAGGTKQMASSNP